MEVSFYRDHDCIKEVAKLVACANEKKIEIDRADLLSWLKLSKITYPALYAGLNFHLTDNVELWETIGLESRLILTLNIPK